MPTLKSPRIDGILHVLQSFRAEGCPRLALALLVAWASCYDVACSGHVLEHTPDTRATIREQWSLLKPGGYLIAHTPNGSQSRREKDPIGFGDRCTRSCCTTGGSVEFWGRTRFWRPPRMRPLSSWAVIGRWDARADLSGAGLLVVARKVEGRS